MDVLHNLFTTVEETITLRALSGLVPISEGQSPHCHPLSDVSGGEMLQPAVPQGGLGVCCQPVQGHQCFPDSEIQPQGLEHLKSLGERGYRGGDEG